MTDEIGGSTLINCGFKIANDETVASKQRPRTPFNPYSWSFPQWCFTGYFAPRLEPAEG